MGEHYFDGITMPIIKHGFVKDGDALPYWWGNAREKIGEGKLRLWDGFITEINRSKLIKSVYMENDHICIKTDDDKVLRVLPVQVQLYYYREDSVFLKVVDFEQALKEVINSVPYMFDHIGKNIKKLNFHSVKSPKTVKLISDLTKHLLDPMSVDCPNENMQAGIQEILWHMNNHIKEGDYFILEQQGKLIKGRVREFNVNRGMIDYYNLRKESNDFFFISDTKSKIVKYFGIEKWAYPDKESALKAMETFFTELINRGES